MKINRRQNSNNAFLIWLESASMKILISVLRCKKIKCGMEEVHTKESSNDSQKYRPAKKAQKYTMKDINGSQVASKRIF